MFWIDEIADEIIKAYPQKDKLIARDEKTLSGRVHVGSLRGVVIHGVVAQALREKGKETEFIFELNDVDPMDGMPVYLDRDQFLQHMGKPLKNVPSPDGKAKNFATYFGEEFVKVIDSLGLAVTYTWASQKYESGLYDSWIKKAMEKEAVIRGIYKEVSGSEKPEDWHPLQVICENCGKVGTTKVTSWDGELATYRCEPNMVKWAEGCGHEGKLSPFKGKGKLPWKVEWPVKWAVYNVDIEGSGKDHGTAGGSHDIGVEICKKVLETPVPFNIPYEFFLFGGAKMSSSKGEGATAHAISQILPPELLRFLMIRSKPNQPIDFNPDGDAIPRLFDRYDECADHYFGRVDEVNPDFKQAYHYAQTTPQADTVYHPRFSRLAFLLQIPHVDMKQEVEKIKGSPLTPADEKELQKRLHYAKLWLEEYASDSAKFSVQYEAIPEEAHYLSEDQKKFLKNVVKVLQNDSLSAEEVHGQIHAIRKDSTLEPREAFAAIYSALIGKDSGPQAGWFLDSLPHDFVLERLTEVAELPFQERPKLQPVIGKLLHIHEDVRERFPHLSIGLVPLSELEIQMEHPGLEAFKKDWMKKIDAADLKKNSEILKEYKAMFQAFGVSPSKNKPSSVALIDRLANGKEIYKINTLVDVCNLIVAKNQITISAFDADHLVLPIILRFSKKGEKFLDMSDGKERPLDEGELVYADANGQILTRDFNYRDSLKTAVTEATKNALLVMDGNAAVTMETVQNSMTELLALVDDFCPATIGEHEWLNTDL